MKILMSSNPNHYLTQMISPNCNFRTISITITTIKKILSKIIQNNKIIIVIICHQAAKRKREPS